jgi:hypothetical protein
LHFAGGAAQSVTLQIYAGSGLQVSDLQALQPGAIGKGLRVVLLVEHGTQLFSTQLQPVVDQRGGRLCAQFPALGAQEFATVAVAELVDLKVVVWGLR